MPRPNPPRKRPRRRPDAVERNTRAEVSLTKQTAQVKERNGAPDAKSPNAKPVVKAKPVKGVAGGRVRRIDEPYVPWAKRSYAILIVCLALAEFIVGAVAYFTLSSTAKDPRPDFGLYLLGLSYNPLIVLASALVAAPIAKFIARETRSLRFMESVMVGILQYFIWLALFVALTFVVGGFGANSPAATNGAPSATATPLPTSSASPAASASASPSSSASSSASAAANTGTVVATPVAIAGLAIIDILSFVGTFYIYPPLYKRMRIKPPPPRGPRPPKQPKPAEPAAKGPKSNVDGMDDAAAREPTPKDPTP
jgi:septal ring-binding cell division protein DamX